jgi:hypothetical protein
MICIFEGFLEHGEQLRSAHHPRCVDLEHVMYCLVDPQLGKYLFQQLNVTTLLSHQGEQRLKLAPGQSNRPQARKRLAQM